MLRDNILSLDLLLSRFAYISERLKVEKRIKRRPLQLVPHPLPP